MNQPSSQISNQPSIYDFLVNNKLEEGIAFLIQNLDDSTNDQATKALTALVRVNNLFTVVSKQAVYEAFHRNKHKVNDSDLRYCNILTMLYPIKPSIAYFCSDHIKQTSIFRTILPDLANESAGVFMGLAYAIGLEKPAISTAYNDIDTTIFQFMIPGRAREGSIEIKLDSAAHGLRDIQMIELSHFWQHPLYFYIDALIFSGNTLAHILDWDIYAPKQEYTFIQFKLAENFHPEFEYKNHDGELSVVYKDFEEERNITGFITLPSKIRALRILKDIVIANPEGFDIKAEEVTAELFSFFRVIHASEIKNTIIHHAAYFFTNDGIYKKFMLKYLERTNLINFLPNDFVDTFKNYKINNVSDLYNFIKLLFDNVLLNRVTHKSGYKYFWIDTACEKEPKKEIDTQPYILNVIEPLCEVKGVGVVREPASAEGEIDMLFSYTANGKLLKVCVEIKRAQHDKIASAIGTQLKRYLESQQTKYGLYIVLWYKSASKGAFNEPTKYNSPDALVKAIESNKPVGYETDVILVDCTKPISPSVV